MKKILISILLISASLTLFAQRQFIPWFQANDITNLRYFIWRGDTIDFNAIQSTNKDYVTMRLDTLLIDNGVGGYDTLVSVNLVTAKDSTILFVTPQQLSDSLNAHPGTHDAVTLNSSASTGGLTLSNQELGFQPVTTSQNGYLTWENFNLFNNKLGVVNHDATLTGLGTLPFPLKVDTALIATRKYVNGMLTDSTLMASRYWVLSQNYISSTDGDWTGTFSGKPSDVYLNYDSLNNLPTIPEISDIAYGPTWDSNIDGASKNAIFDKIESLAGGHDPITLDDPPNGLGLSEQVLSMDTASVSSIGTLGSYSYSLFNNKGSVSSVAATAPAAGFTITGSPIQTTGTFVFALANDLAALENLSTTGLAKRTGVSTWATITDNSIKWDSAYSWGDHSKYGYITGENLGDSILANLDAAVKYTDSTTIYVTPKQLSDSLTNLVVAGSPWQESAGEVTLVNSASTVGVGGTLATAKMFVTGTQARGFSATTSNTNGIGVYGAATGDGSSIGLYGISSSNSGTGTFSVGALRDFHAGGSGLYSMTTGVTPTLVTGEGGLYAKTDGKVYYKYGANAEIDLTAGGGSSNWTVSGANIFRNSNVAIGGTSGLASYTFSIDRTAFGAFGTMAYFRGSSTVNYGLKINTGSSTGTGSILLQMGPSSISSYFDFYGNGQARFIQYGGTAMNGGTVTKLLGVDSNGFIWSTPIPEENNTGSAPGGADNSIQFRVNSTTFGGFGTWDGTTMTVPGIQTTGNIYSNSGVIGTNGTYAVGLSNSGFMYLPTRSTPAAPVSGVGYIYMNSGDNLIYFRNSTGNFNLTSGFTDPMEARGDIIYRNSSNSTERLAKGSVGQVLTSGENDIGWAAPAGTGWTDNGTTINLTTHTDNVGIGTTANPSYKVFIEGASNQSAMYSISNATTGYAGHFVNTGTTGNSYGIYALSGSSTDGYAGYFSGRVLSTSTIGGTTLYLGSSSTWWRFAPITNGVEIGSSSSYGGAGTGKLRIYNDSIRSLVPFNVTGAVTSTSTFTGTNFILSSDKRLKARIKPLNDLKWVDKIDFYNFHFKGDLSQRKRYGVIAQEIEKVAPEFVYDNEKGIKSVAYTDLIIAKVARQDQQIEALQKEVTELKKMVEQLLKKK